jgi:single-strand DNA-binding protein
MNKLMIIGRVGKDPLINTVNGKQVANFSVAVSKKINGNDQTTWFDVALWDKPAVYPYIKKGGQLLVEGEVSLRQYDKNDGTKGASLNISAFQIQLLGGAPQNSEAPAPAAQQQQPAASTDTLPF